MLHKVNCKNRQHLNLDLLDPDGIRLTYSFLTTRGRSFINQYTIVRVLSLLPVFCILALHFYVRLGSYSWIMHSVQISSPENMQKRKCMYKQPEGALSASLWRMYIWFSTTFALSVMEPWEQMLVSK